MSTGVSRRGLTDAMRSLHSVPIMDLAVAQALWAIDRLQASQLPTIAQDALEVGYDSPALRMLAGLIPVDVHLAPDLFQRALDELQIHSVTPLNALHLFIRYRHSGL